MIRGLRTYPNMSEFYRAWLSGTKPSLFTRRNAEPAELMGKAEVNRVRFNESTIINKWRCRHGSKSSTMSIDAR